METAGIAAIFAGAAGVAHGISRPLTKLIETVRAGIGDLYEPAGIRRKAHAQADAMEILAHGEGKAADIAQRAAHRIANRELRRQHNIEKVMQDSVRFLPTDVAEGPVDVDWAVQFFEHCQDVSDKQMQSVWSRMLAGEVAKPGTFSLRTLQTVKTLRPNDAQKFTTYCRFVWKSLHEQIVVFIAPDAESADRWPPDCRTPLLEIYKQNGIDGLARVHLQSLNLVHVSEGGWGIGIEPDERGQQQLVYYDNTYTFRHRDPKGRTLHLQADVLTDIGRELAPISGATPDAQHEAIILQAIRGMGFLFDTDQPSD